MNSAKSYFSWTYFKLGKLRQLREREKFSSRASPAPNHHKTIYMNMNVNMKEVCMKKDNRKENISGRRRCSKENFGGMNWFTNTYKINQRTELPHDLWSHGLNVYFLWKKIFLLFFYKMYIHIFFSTGKFELYVWKIGHLTALIPSGNCFFSRRGLLT